VTPEHWQEVKEVLAGALERKPAERSAYLDQACPEPSLRREVESLLAAHEQGSSSFLESPALEDTGLKTGTKLGPYQIVGAIGAGGMGEVYRAHDTRLGRDVALKVLPEAFARNAERLSRFQREAKLLAAMNHSNIATIHGFEQFQDVHFLVMELVPGETLSELLESGPLKVNEALKISAQIAEALAAAHKNGVIHRDLKPSNVKVTPDGRVKLLDFGLAKTIVGVGGQEISGSTTLSATSTSQGWILGTPAYMSPEQARGQAVDNRTDIWAFGCVLYELLTGRRAFPGETIPDIIAVVLEREPDLQTLPLSVPASIRELIRRCLRKNAEARLHDIADARTETEEALLSSTKQRVPESERPFRSLAVLPLANASADPQMEYLSDGLTESIILNLSQLPELRVVARSTVFQYKGRGQEAREFGRMLGVGAVLTGRVLQRDDTLHISVELVDVENGWQVWGAQFRRKVIDIFSTEEEIAKEISQNLLVKLAPEKQNLLARRYTENVQAYHLYLKGRFYWGKRTDEGLRKAIQYFNQAIEVDPTYALAYAGLAEGYVPLGVYCHLPPKEAFPKARAAANRALEIDPALSEARTVVAAIQNYFEWDLEGAEKAFREAIELNPNYPRARQGLADCLTAKRQFPEAATEVRRALELDPLSLHMNAAVVMTHYFGRQYDQAIEHGCVAVELDSSFYPTHFYLALAYEQKGRFSDAAAELEQARVLSNNSTLMTASLGRVLAVWGKKEEARSILRELAELASRKYVSQVFVAMIYAGLGEKDRALACLDIAFDERCSWLLRCMMTDARLDSLRDETCFQNLIQRMESPQWAQPPLGQTNAKGT